MRGGGEEHVNEQYSTRVLCQEREPTHFLIIKDPTMTRAPPVAHDGIEANIGAKKIETKNIRPVTMAVIPVLPPSGARILALLRGVEGAIQSNTHPQYRWPIQCRRLPAKSQEEHQS